MHQRSFCISHHRLPSSRQVFQLLHHATHIAPHRSPSAARVTSDSIIHYRKLTMT
ncbi:hypothetical protein BC835DRAFT_1394802, partial [Cytidiella melzeri]